MKATVLIEDVKNFQGPIFNNTENIDEEIHNVKDNVKNEKFDLLIEKTIELSNKYNTWKQL